MAGAAKHVRVPISDWLLAVSAETLACVRELWGPSWPPNSTVDDGNVTCKGCGPIWAADVTASTPVSDGRVTPVTVAIACHRVDAPMHSLGDVAPLHSDYSKTVNVLQLWTAELLTPAVGRSTKLGRAGETTSRLALLAHHNTSFIRDLRWHPAIQPEEVCDCVCVCVCSDMHGWACACEGE